MLGGMSRGTMEVEGFNRRLNRPWTLDVHRISPTTGDGPVVIQSESLALNERMIPRTVDSNDNACRAPITAVPICQGSGKRRENNSADLDSSKHRGATRLHSTLSVPDRPKINVTVRFNRARFVVSDA